MSDDCGGIGVRDEAIAELIGDSADLRRAIGAWVEGLCMATVANLRRLTGRIAT